MLKYLLIVLEKSPINQRYKIVDWNINLEDVRSKLLGAVEVANLDCLLLVGFTESFLLKMDENSTVKQITNWKTLEKIGSLTSEQTAFVSKILKKLDVVENFLTQSPLLPTLKVEKNVVNERRNMKGKVVGSYEFRCNDICVAYYQVYTEQFCSPRSMIRDVSKTAYRLIWNRSKVEELTGFYPTTEALRDGLPNTHFSTATGLPYSAAMVSEELKFFIINKMKVKS